MNGITMWRPDPVFSRWNSTAIRGVGLAAIVPNGDQTLRQTMAKQGQSTTNLEGLTIAAREATNTTPAGRGLPPVHLWNPPFCGDLDMRIASDGTWFYMGTPIGRPALVRLFSTILKREDGKHFLVTPVEKVGIRVDDAPFLAVEMLKENDASGPLLRFRTNVDDWVSCDAAHRLRFEAAADGGLTPYLHVRADLWAKVTRPLYYDLVDIGEERVVDGHEMFGVASSGEFFAMADAEEVRAAL
jgi:uncharacterized protein